CDQFHAGAACESPSVLGMKHLARLGFAICLFASVISLSASAAFAHNNAPIDPDVRCAAKIAPGQYEFYLPGEKATDVNGNKWVCGPDGQWFRDYSALVKSSVITLSPLRTTSLSSFTVLSR